MLDGPNIVNWSSDDSAGSVGGRILTAVVGTGPMVPEIVLHGPEEGESITHRAPRPFTLAQARNQALNHATDSFFDAVVLLSAPPPAWPLAERLWAVAAADPSIAMLTGMGSPSAGSARQWVAEQLWEEFGTEAIDIPAPGPECILLTVTALRRIGIFDANFTKGGEIDLAQKALKAGLRVAAAPAVPLGGPTSIKPEGMVMFRHPGFAKAQRAFFDSGEIEKVEARAASSIVQAAARSMGYAVDVATQPRPMVTPDPIARVSIRPEPSAVVDVRFAGLQSEVEVGDGDAPDVLELAFGRRAERVTVYDAGPAGDRLREIWGDFGGVPVEDKSRV